MIKTYFYNNTDQRMYHDVDLDNTDELLADENNLLWIDLFNCTAADLRFLGTNFHFHQLAIEDCLHDSPRSKVDRYDDYYFFVFHALKYDEESDREITTEELNVFFGKNYVVTVHKRPIPAVGRVAMWSIRHTDYMNKAPDFLLYSLVDGIIDEYFPILDRISARIDELEDEMYVNPAQEISEEFLALKRTIVLIRRVVQPQKRIFANVGGAHSFEVQEGNNPYYMDLVDHLERVSDSLDVFRDLVAGALETYYSWQSAKTNETMRVLTILTTLTATLTAITGYMGMNVPLPFQTHWEASIVVTIVLVAVCWWMMRVFRKRKWI